MSAFIVEKQTFFNNEYTNYVLNAIRFFHTFNTKLFEDKKILDAIQFYTIFETRTSLTLLLNIITFIMYIKGNVNAMYYKSITIIVYGKDKNLLFTKEMHPDREPTRNI